MSSKDEFRRDTAGSAPPFRGPRQAAAKTGTPLGNLSRYLIKWPKALPLLILCVNAVVLLGVIPYLIIRIGDADQIRAEKEALGVDVSKLKVELETLQGEILKRDIAIRSIEKSRRN